MTPRSRDSAYGSGIPCHDDEDEREDADADADAVQASSSLITRACVTTTSVRLSSLPSLG